MDFSHLLHWYIRLVFAIYYNSVRKMNWICQKLCKNLFHGSDRSEEAARSTGNSLQSEEKAVLTEIPRIGISI